MDENKNEIYEDDLPNYEDDLPEYDDDLPEYDDDLTDYEDDPEDYTDSIEELENGLPVSDQDDDQADGHQDDQYQKPAPEEVRNTISNVMEKAFKAINQTGLMVEAVGKAIKNNQDTVNFIINVLPEVLEKSEKTITEAMAKHPECQTLDQLIEALEKDQEIEKEASGAIITIGNRLLVPSSKELRNAFQTNFEENGIFKILNDGSRVPVTDLNYSFLLTLFTVIYYDPNRKQGYTKINFQKIAKECGLSLNTDEEGRASSREKYFLKNVNALNNLWKQNPNDESEYIQLINVSQYNVKTDIGTVSSPYINYILDTAEKLKRRALYEGKKDYISTSKLLHADVANEEDQAAVQLASRIIVGVEEKGKGKLRFRIRADNLVNDCQLMVDKLEKCKSTSNRTTVMKRSFEKMMEILWKKTDIYIKYKDVSVGWYSLEDGHTKKYKKAKMPTSKTLSTTYFGLNHSGKVIEETGKKLKKT